MKYPLDELLDKRSIIQLKIERLGDNSEISRLKEKEYCDYTEAIEEYTAEGVCTLEEIEKWSNQLYSINAKIWDLEADIRQGKEGKLGLEEVGRRAIEIRKNNGIRVGIKSDIVGTVGVGYKDIKINHASE